MTSGNANVRIGFDWNDNRWVTWSYTGTDCKFIRNQNEATVNFALWDAANEATKRADVLRAFGQVLGLELEHRHLSFDAGWTSRISEYWESEIEDIPWNELKEYVFDPIEERNLVQTNEYDENSIMIWPFSRKYADNTARYANYELSETDKQFIGQLYPKEGDEEEDNLLIQFTHVYKQELFSTAIPYIRVENQRSDIVIDWGDGTRETFTPESGIFSHPYSENGEYEVKIYGAEDAIPVFNSSLFEYTEFVVEAGCLMESITIRPVLNTPTATKTVKHMDLSNALALTHLDIFYLSFTDDDAFANMIYSLPQRPVENPGTLLISRTDDNWPMDACAEKNWIVV